MLEVTACISLEKNMEILAFWPRDRLKRMLKLEQERTLSTKNIRNRIVHRFLLIMNFYLTGAQACVCVFSTVDRASFDAMPRWKERVIILYTIDFQMILLSETIFCKYFNSLAPIFLITVYIIVELN